jgi:hypothetical protein
MRKVNIHLNDEAGYDCTWFSVDPCDDKGNWLVSFYSPEDVKKYCKAEGLKIVKIYSSVSKENPNYSEAIKKFSEMSQIFAV